MARSPSLKDPVQYLKNRVVQNGHSGEDGTFLIGASVVFDPNQHAHSDTHDDAISFLKDRIADDVDFARMVAILAAEPVPWICYHIQNYFNHFGCSLHLVRDGQTLSMIAILTEIDVEEFEEDVEFLSHFALWFAKIAGCQPGKVRVTITRATLSWEQMEEEKLLYSVERESN